MNAAEERPAEFVQSLERGLAVIRAFSAEHPALTLSEVAQSTGMTRAAARRFLITLEHLGYVAQHGRLFSLRPSVLRLGYAYLSAFSVADIAQDHLERLAEQLHESCSASVLDGDDIVYVARASTNRIMTIGLSVGTRLPAYCTSMGRVLLAAMPAEEFEDYLDRVEFEPRTHFTITDRAAFVEEINRVRHQGWSLLDQELELGVRSVAAPIHNRDGDVVAAVNTSAHATRVPLKALQTEMLKALRRAADDIDQDLVQHRD